MSLSVIRQFISATAAVVLLLGLSGCNHDVFIDGHDAPDDMEATIEGDGGEVTFTIATKGLERIRIPFLDDSRYTTYYNTAGDKTDAKIQANDLGKIVYDSRLLHMEIIKRGNRITVRSEECAYDGPASWDIVLDYDYLSSVRNIYITIMPGKPLELVSIKYEPGIDVTERAEMKSGCTTYTSTDMTWDVQVAPYINHPAESTIEVSRTDTWMESFSLDMDMLVFEDGEWIFRRLEDIHTDKPYKYRRPDYNMVDRVVTILPGTTTRIYNNVWYSRATASGTFVLRRPVSGRLLEIPFVCKSIYPVSYEIRVE